MKNHNLENFYWIGGCPSSGKTTLAAEISKQSGIGVYHTDDHIMKYAPRFIPKQPKFHESVHMNFVESMVTMPNNEWFDMFIAGMREFCSIILSDVKELFIAEKMIVEGGYLLPEFVSDIGCKNRAVFINGSYEYLREYLPKQKWVVEMVTNIESYERKALFIERFVYKYNLFREYVIKSAEKLGMKTVFTNAPNSLEDNVKITMQHIMSVQYKHVI